mgnify:CR=1 FL=1
MSYVLVVLPMAYSSRSGATRKCYGLAFMLLCSVMDNPTIRIIVQNLHKYMAKNDKPVDVPIVVTTKAKTFICKPPRPRLKVVRYKKVCKNC